MCVCVCLCVCVRYQIIFVLIASMLTWDQNDTNNICVIAQTLTKQSLVVLACKTRPALVSLSETQHMQVVHNTLHMIGARWVAHDFHRIVPCPLEHTCRRQFTVQRGDCKKSQTASLNAIIIIITSSVFKWTRQTAMATEMKESSLCHHLQVRGNLVMEKYWWQSIAVAYFFFF